MRKTNENSKQSTTKNCGNKNCGSKTSGKNCGKNSKTCK